MGWNKNNGDLKNIESKTFKGERAHIVHTHCALMSLIML